MTLEQLNELSADDAASALRSCCGSTKWVEAMIAARPFRSANHLLESSDSAWQSTDAADWHEAFSHHPRIGAQAKGWAASEQSGMQEAQATVQKALADVNREYEQRFGHIYIVCATGRTAGEMLAIARERLHNDPATELRIAADEQHKITQLRLRKLLGDTT